MIILNSKFLILYSYAPFPPLLGGGREGASLPIALDIVSYIQQTHPIHGNGVSLFIQNSQISTFSTSVE